MKTVKFIEIVFENCEVIRIPGDRVDGLVLTHPSREFRRIGGKIVSFIAVENAAFALLPKANVEYLPFNDEKQVSIKVFDRINQYKDITAINCIYDDNTEELYYVDYCLNEANGDNRFQHNCLEKTGMLYVFISKDYKEPQPQSDKIIYIGR